MSRVDNNYFTYRQTPATENGTGTLESIKGNTIVWNQLYQNTNIPTSQTKNGVTLTNNNDGSWTLNGTASANTYFYGFNGDIVPIVGHKYLMKDCVPSGVNNFYCIFEGARIDASRNNIIVTATSSTASNATAFQILSGVTVNVTFRPQIFDLTKMGLDITDPSDFISLFPLSYYSYNQGSLLSFMGNGIKTVGKNLVNVDSPNIVNAYINAQGDILTNQQWSTSDYVRVFPNSTYKLSGLTSHPNTNTDNFVFYDGSQTKVGYQSISANDSLTIPNGVVYVRFCWKKTEKDSVMFELGSTATSFEPYTESTLSLPTQQYFPTGMKSAGTVYDELTESKAITRIGAVDLGSLTWQTSTNNRMLTTGLRTLIKIPSSTSVVFNGICPKYIADTNVNVYNNTNPNTMAVNANGDLLIYDVNFASYTADTFKTAMSGVYLYYELATPTETDISPELDLTFNIDAGGTEQLLPVNGSTPTTSPILCDIFYRGMIPVSVVVYPIGAGTVEGAGQYRYGETATLVATPNDIYRFLRYEDENGDTLSTDSTYSFEVGE